MYSRFLDLVGSVIVCLFHIYCGVRSWKKFQYRLTFGKVISKSRVSFLTHGVHIPRKYPRTTRDEYPCNFQLTPFFLRWSLRTTRCRL